MAAQAKAPEDLVWDILLNLCDQIQRIALDCNDLAAKEALLHYIKKARDDYAALGLTPDQPEPPPEEEIPPETRAAKPPKPTAPPSNIPPRPAAPPRSPPDSSSDCPAAPLLPGRFLAGRPMRDEDKLQASIVDYLRLVLPRHVVFAIPNAARRTKYGRAANAVPGLKPGVPDLCILGWGGQSYLIEVKTKKGVLSKDQIDVMDELDRLEAPYGIARSIEDARVLLEGWRIKTREAQPA